MVGIDSVIVNRVRLARGDNSWETLSTVVNLPIGYHVIVVGFLNDGGDGLFDRDGVINWITLTGV